VAAPKLNLLKFGNRAVPGSGAVLGWVDLNDGTTWMTEDFEVVDARLLTHARQLFAGSGVRLGGDDGPKAIKIVAKYDEGPTGVSVSAAKAALVRSGEQWLTTDNATQVIVEMKLCTAKIARKGTNKLYQMTLDFIARNPWAEDMAATTIAAFAVNGSITPGTANTFNVTYNAPVYGRPTWTLTIPVGNTVGISKFVLANTTSGETLTVIFPVALAAATAWTITIDCLGWTVKDQNGLEYDIAGSFPQLYGPPGTVNNYSLTLTTASGTSTGVTLAASWLNRWELA
jgi:hypothetical protein